MMKILERQSLPKSIKVRLVEAMIFPIPLYGRKSWTMKRMKPTRLTHLSYGAEEECYEFRGKRLELMRRYEKKYDQSCHYRTGSGKTNSIVFWLCGKG